MENAEGAIRLEDLRNRSSRNAASRCSARSRWASSIARCTTTSFVLDDDAQSLEIELDHRRQLEKALRAARRKAESDLRDFIDNAPIAFHWVSGDGTILWADKAEVKMLGFSYAQRRLRSPAHDPGRKFAMSRRPCPSR